MALPAPSALRAAAWLLAAAAAVPGAAGAHDFWIEPSTFRPVPGQRVEVGLRVGQDFAGEEVPRIPPLVARFVARGEGGERPVLGRDGASPAGAVAAGGQGPLWIAYESRGSRLELPPDRFEAYLAEEGLEAISRRRALAGDGGEPGREAFFRSAKSLLCVAGPAAPAGAAEAFGLPIELIPEEDLCLPRAAGSFGFRLLFRGQPLAGALVVALARTAPAVRVAVRSDAAGRVRLSLDAPGVWLVKAVHMEAAPAASGLDWHSHWASLTFERP